ncbi:MAG: polyketide cyclase [Verrucomicrobia bacterium]|nr:polyketide cyclase [Verrucomicrobiota bacterium]
MSGNPIETDPKLWPKATERQVLRVGDRTSALLRRRFDTSPETIWAACTERDPLRRWFADVSGDLHEGASLTFDVGAPCRLTSRVLRCEPPRRLRFTWSYPGREIDEVELRLAAAGNGTRLELEHRLDDKSEWWYGAGSGWEFALIKLGVLLRGGDPLSINAQEFDPILGPLWITAGAAIKQR